MADKIIGRVSIKVMPEVDNHRPEMARDMERLLDKMERNSKKRKPIKVEVELDTDGLEKDLDRALDKAKKDTEKKKLNLKVGFDYDDVLRGTEQIRAALKELDRSGKDHQISIELNEKELNKELKKLNRRLKNDPVHMRISNDLDGYREVLKKIQGIRKEASKIDVSFKTDPASLRKAENEIRKTFKDQIVDLTGEGFRFKSELDRDSLKKAIAEVEKAKRDLEHKPIEIQTGMNMAGVNRANRELRSRLAKTPISFRYDPDSPESIENALKELRKDLKEQPLKGQIEIENPNPGAVKAKMVKLQQELGVLKATIQVDYNDQESLKAAKKRIDEELKGLRANKVPLNIGVDEQSLLEAKHKVESFIKDENGKEIDLNVNPTGLALAGARLSYLTRPRTVSIIAKVDAKSLAIATGLLKSMAGVGVLQRLGNTLENVITNFDKFAVKSTSFMTAFASLSNVLTYMGTSLFTIGGGISQVIGLAALLPALGASTAAVFTVLTMGFNNFSQSFSDIPIVAEQALAKLPPAARKARDSMVGLWSAVRDPVQNKFWEELGTSVQDFAHRVMPQVGQGLLAITPAVARFTKNTLDSFKEIAENGQMREMFKNLGTGFDNLSRGAKPFFDALNTLGLRGSQFLPRMGDALADMAEDFDDWITRADKAGDINRWIEEGITALEDMGGVVHAVGRQFIALTQIIDAAGGQGLDGFRKNMEGWADVMEREPFRSNMVRILRGARDGASELNVGFKNLTGTIGESSHSVEALLTLLGKVGGGALTRISDILGRNTFQSGLLVGVEKVNTALDRLQPAAKNIGDILGNMFDVSGSVILGITPMLNQVTGIIRTIVTDLAPTLKDTVPILTGFVGNLLAVTQGPLQLMSDGLKIVVDILKVMPAGMQNMVVAFATFLALRGRIGGMMTAMDKFFTSAGNGFKGTKTAVVMNSDAIKSKIEAIPVATGKAATGVEKQTGKMRTAFTRTGTSLSKFGGVLGGVMGLAGGLGGALIFTGVIAGISAIGNAAREKQQDIENFRGTLDEFGNSTADTLKAAAEWMTTTTSKFEGGQKPIAEVFDALGIGSANAAKAMSGSLEDFDSFFKKITDRQAEVSKLADERLAQQTNLANDGSMRTEAQMKITEGYQDERNALDALIPQLKAYGDMQHDAMKKASILAQAQGLNVGASKDLTKAFADLKDEASSVPARIDAMSTALDVLNNGMNSKVEGAIAFADTIRNLKDTIKEAATGGKDGKPIFDMKNLIGNNGVIDVTFKGDPSGLKAQMYTFMYTGVNQGIADGIKAANTAPPAGKLAAFRAAFEEAIGTLRATIEPQLDSNPAKARAKFDSWFKASGLDQVTIEAIIDGTISREDLAKIPPEILSMLQPLLDNNPAKVPLDGDYLPLQEKATLAQGILAKLGATKTTPKIGADGKELTEEQKKAINALRKLDESTATAKILADGSPLTKSQQKAMRQLLQIDSFTAVPKFDADGKPLSDKTRIALAKLLGIDTTKAEAKLDADDRKLKEKTEAGKAKLAKFAKEHPRPKLDANGEPLKHQVQTAKERIDALGRKHVNPSVSISVYGLGSVSYGLALMNSFKSRRVQIGVEYKQYGQARVADGAITGHGSQYRLKPSAHRHFMDGGFSKPTSAHIAKDGSFVTYAETGTGDEAFIPMSASKRARSSAILAEVARRFGMQLTKNGKSFADGAVNAGASGATYNITNHYPQAEPTSSSINRAAQVSTIRDRT